MTNIKTPISRSNININDVLGEYSLGLVSINPFWSRNDNLLSPVSGGRLGHVGCSPKQIGVSSRHSTGHRHRLLREERDRASLRGNNSVKD